MKGMNKGERNTSNDYKHNNNQVTIKLFMFLKGKNLYYSK